MGYIGQQFYYPRFKKKKKMIDSFFGGQYITVSAPIFQYSSIHTLNVAWPWFKNSITKRNKEQGF